MRENFRKIMNKEKSRAVKSMKNKGGNYEDYKPFYFDEEIWNKFCVWWRSEQFGKRSVAGRGARGRVKVPHTSGARTFEGRRRVSPNTYHFSQFSPVKYFTDIFELLITDLRTVIEILSGLLQKT